MESESADLTLIKQSKNAEITRITKSENADVILINETLLLSITILKGAFGLRKTPFRNL